MYKLNVKDLVDKKFGNINQFAVAIKLAYGSAEKIYRGEVTRIALDTLESICDVLNCTPNDVIKRVDKDTQKQTDMTNPEDHVSMSELSSKPILVNHEAIQERTELLYPEEEKMRKIAEDVFRQMLLEYASKK